MRVSVVGAGIIGTTTAFRLKRKYPDLEMTIIADKFSPNTTSDVAAGWWEPHLDPDTPPHLIEEWAGHTYDFFLRLWRSQPDQEVEDIQNQLREGLSLMTGTGVSSDPTSLNQAWTSQVLSYSVNCEPGRLSSLGFQSSDDMVSHSFLSFTFEPAIVLPVFYTWLKQNGVHFIEKKLDDFESLLDTEDIVINCSGLGAKQLVGDDNVYPVSGHVIRAKIPTAKLVLSDDRTQSWAYIIPNRDTVVLGSVDEPGNWNTQISQQNSQKILKNCQKICPAVQSCEIVSEQVGLRPCRKGGVRLCLQNNKRGKIIDNYGHGGSGVTLSWGCARQVVKLVQTIIEE